jgi:hypothetical protein
MSDTDVPTAIGLGAAILATLWFTVVGRRRRLAGTNRGVFSPRFAGGVGVLLFIVVGVVVSLTVYYVLLAL